MKKEEIKSIEKLGISKEEPEKADYRQMYLELRKKYEELLKYVKELTSSIENKDDN